MNRFKLILKNIVLLSFPAIIITIALMEYVVFEYVLPATEFPNLIYDEEFLVKRFYKNGKKKGQFTGGKWAQNRVQWEINNEGWMSHIDYERKKKRPRIAVIGDSFVMPAENNTIDGFSQQLHEMMKDSLDVYSFGVGSTPLSNYLQLAKLVKKRFQPDIYVINLVTMTSKKVFRIRQKRLSGPILWLEIL